MAKNILFQPFQLVDLNTLSDEELNKYTWLSILQVCLKYARTKDAAQLIHSLSYALQQVEQLNGMEYIEAVFTYLFCVSEVTDVDHLWTTINEVLSQETKGEIMTTMAELLEAKGEQRGINIGIEKGKKLGSLEEKKLIALKLIQNNVGTIQMVAEITGLPEKIVQNLKHELIVVSS